MSNFDELLKALETSSTESTPSYADQSKEIYNILDKAINTIKDLPGDKFDGKVTVREEGMIIVKVTLIIVNSDPVIAFIDGPNGLKVDLHPTDRNAKDLVEIPDDDASTLKSIVESIKDFCKSSNSELEETLSGVMATAVKTLKGTASEPYKDLRTFWYRDHLFISDGPKHLGVFVFNGDKAMGSDDIMKGPEALQPLSDECSRVLRQGFEVIKTLGKNSHNESDGLETAISLVDSLPTELRNSLLHLMEGVFKK